MLGIILGRVLTTWGQPRTTLWTNKMAILVRFALRGGLTTDDPGALLSKVRELSPFIETRQSRSHFSVALFGFLVVITYLIGRWRFRVRPTSLGPLTIYPVSRTQRIMAGGLGAINGYLLAHSLIPLLFPQETTIIQVPSGQLSSLLDEELELVIIGFILILILFGLQRASRSRS